MNFFKNIGEGAVGILVGEPIAVIAVDGADLSNIKDYEYSEKKPYVYSFILWNFYVFLKFFNFLYFFRSN